jgi:hypothetical protein
MTCKNHCPNRNVCSHGCKVTGCIEKKRGKGYCSRHYQRLRAGLSLEEPTIYDIREPIITPSNIQIPLGVSAKNGYAVVDLDTDKDVYMRKYSIDNTGYPRTTINGRGVRLHRLIIESVPPGSVVDHINQNKLDNRKQNLRIVSRAVNQRNSKISKKVTFDGVTLTLGEWADRIGLRPETLRSRLNPERQGWSVKKAFTVKHSELRSLKKNHPRHSAFD